MPRGKYDRKESRIQRLEQEAKKTHERVRSLSDELSKKEVELKAAKKIADVVSRVPASPDVMPTEKFSILRDNLKMLSEARRTLAEGDVQVNAVTLAVLDEEISQHLHMLATLREEAFHMPSVRNGAPVPLPTSIPPYFKSVG
jgi:hypothetical protein